MLSLSGLWDIVKFQQLHLPSNLALHPTFNKHCRGLG